MRTRRPNAMRGLSQLARIGGLALVAAVLLTGCNTYKNSHGRQNKPHVLRIVSIPSNAKLTIPGRKLMLYTPADIEVDLGKGDAIVVEKDGYLPFEGVLGDLPQVARQTYEVRLTPR